MNALKLNITDLAGGEKRFALTVNLTDLELEEAPEFNEPVRFEIALNQIGERIFLHAHIETNIDLICDRCLKDYVDGIKHDVNLVITSASDFEEGDDDDVIVIKKGELSANVAPTMREIILLELPIKRLCNENCKGLCPNCGVDLNSETCNCDLSMINPRWEALRGLLE